MSLIAGIRALVIEFFYSAYVLHPQILSQGTFSGISDIGPSLNNHSKRRKHGYEFLNIIESGITEYRNIFPPHLCKPGQSIFLSL